MVWVGLISYPLYLWHWPLLSFARIVESETPSRNIRIAAVAISFVLAGLTYYLIEKRVRYGRSTWRKVAVLSVLAVLVGYVGYNAYSRDGLAFRIPDSFKRLERTLSPETQNLNEISIVNNYCRNRFPADELGYCRLSQDAEPNIILIGDSHAASLFYGFAKRIQGSQNTLLVS